MSLDNFTELQERIIRALIEGPLHRDDLAEKLDVKSNQITRGCNQLSKGTFEYVREVSKQTWQITVNGRALRFKSKSSNNNLRQLRSKGEIEVTDTELDILSALASFTKAQVSPCGAELFAACQENDESRKQEYYDTINDLVAKGHIKEIRQNYGSAVYWTRYSLADPNLLKTA